MKNLKFLSIFLFAFIFVVSCEKNEVNDQEKQSETLELPIPNHSKDNAKKSAAISEDVSFDGVWKITYRWHPEKRWIKDSGTSFDFVYRTFLGGNHWTFNKNTVSWGMPAITTKWDFNVKNIGNDEFLLSGFGEFKYSIQSVWNGKALIIGALNEYSIESGEYFFFEKQ